MSDLPAPETTTQIYHAAEIAELRGIREQLTAMVKLLTPAKGATAAGTVELKETAAPARKPSKKK